MDNRSTVQQHRISQLVVEAVIALIEVSKSFSTTGLEALNGSRYVLSEESISTTNSENIE
jgi:hypothetical protein